MISCLRPYGPKIFATKPARTYSNDHALYRISAVSIIIGLPIWPIAIYELPSLISR
jgi:hypothetical protein